MPPQYNRQNAVAYAHHWAFFRNPAYMDFHGLGGDCTNFVSQCLKAGGAPQNYTKDLGWYYSSPQNRAAAWTGCEQLFRFLTNNRSVGPKAKIIPLSDVQPGDVIQLSFREGVFSHSLMVVSVNHPTDGTPPSPSDVFIACHSMDSDHRPLSSFFYQDLRCLRISL